MPPSLQQIQDFVGRDSGLAVVSVVRPDGTPASSLVNAGIIDHPVSGERCAAFVMRGSAKKASHLRLRPHVSLVWRDGWQWVGLAGPAELVGPDDTSAGPGADDLRLLLRDVFRGAGGSHDDWETFDRVMADERRLAVLVQPLRLSGNPG